jgi:hypothetical protein
MVHVKIVSGKRRKKDGKKKNFVIKKFFVALRWRRMMESGDVD